MHDRAESIRREVLSGSAGRWDGLSGADRHRLEHLTRAIVEAVLREPTIRLRARESAGDADIAGACFLFALDPPPADPGGEGRRISPPGASRTPPRRCSTSTIPHRVRRS
ncbi:MAG: hypothetical protein IT200_10960 [Thermoleophilia bacterium]|nr:hypothetical protein [Thermoleophilia bacterium]